jgi:hypothetical protein
MLNGNTFSKYTSQVVATEMIWTDHKCCNITVSTVQNILGVNAYFLHGIIVSTSVTVCFSEGSLNTFHLFLSCIFEHKYLLIASKSLPKFLFCSPEMPLLFVCSYHFWDWNFWPGCWHCCLVFRGSWVQVNLWDRLSWWCFMVLETTARVLPEMRLQSPHHPFIIHNPLFDLSCTSIAKWTINK